MSTRWARPRPACSARCCSAPPSRRLPISSQSTVFRSCSVSSIQSADVRAGPRQGLALRADRARGSLVQEQLHGPRRRAGRVLSAGAARLGRDAPLALAVLATCLVASSNYVLNELLDAPTDSLHPEKRYRPVPSGRVKPRDRATPSGSPSAPRACSSRGRSTATSRRRRCGCGSWACSTTCRRSARKEWPYVDVLSESVNNPIRLLLGWFALLDTAGAAGLADAVVLDDRGVLHGDEAVRGAAPYRRPASWPRRTGIRSRTTPNPGCWSACSSTPRPAPCLPASSSCATTWS